MRSWIGRISRPALRLGVAAITRGNRSLDIGPFPMDWPNINSEALTATTDRLQVTSINVPVTFTANAPTGMTVNAVVNGSTSDTGAVSTPMGASPTPFTVPPNSFVWFVCSAAAAAGGTITVRNSTAGSAVVDAIVVNLGTAPPPEA